MTTPNTTDSNPEVNEDVNTQNQDRDLHSKLLRKFTANKLKNKKKRASFVKQVNADGEITPAILEEIRKFAQQNPDFDGLTIDSSMITYRALQSEVAWYITTRSNNRLQLKSIFLKENAISPDEYEKKIWSKVEKIEDDNLELLLSKSTERNKLLAKIYWKKGLPATRDMMSFLWEVDLTNRFSKLNEHETLLIKSIHSKFEKWEKIDTTDLLTLFESSVFTHKEKSDLLKVFVPTLSLRKAINLWLISQKDAEVYKTNISKREARAGRWDEEVIRAALRDSEVLIPTYTFLDKKKNVEAIIDDVLPLREAVRDFDEVANELKESMTDIKTLDDFISELGKHPKVNGEDTFSEWSILEIKQVQQTPDGPRDVVLYGKILKTSDRWELKLLDRWEWAYTTQPATVSTRTYDDIISLIDNGQPKIGLETLEVNIMSESTVRAKIQKKEIKNGDEDAVFRDKSEINSRIDELKDERLEREKALIASWKTRLEIEQDDEIQRISREQEKEVDSLDDLDDLNLSSLKTTINDLDAKWGKFWFEYGTAFQVWKWKLSGNIYTIIWIDAISWTIDLTSPGWSETLRFDQFVANFKDSDCKRVSKTTTFQGIFESIQSDWSDEIKSTWENFELDGSSIKRKEWVKWVAYDFLVSAKGAKWNNEKLLQIHSESSGLFTISLWSYKDAKKAKTWKDGKYNPITRKQEDIPGNPETFSVEDKKYAVTAAWLDAYIRENDLIPRWLQDAKEQEKIKWEKLQQNFNVWSFLGKGLNIATVAASGKVFYEWLENYFKEWRDERAARFAYAWWKHLLPWDMKWDLRSRIEEAQKKRADDYLERLKKLASFHATEMIEWWLLDPNTKEEKKEAAVEFMFSKYGTLCSKWALYPYQWKFMWYQALWGKIDPPDELYLKQQAEAERLNEQFSEEGLVWMLIKKQCWPKWHNGIKRRSKWYKALKKDRSVWKTQEIETGRNDAWDERNIESRIGWGMSELYGGNYPTAIWWMEKVVDKGWPMHLMNKLPFVMAFSWAWYNFDSKVTNDAIKWFQSQGRLISMTRFMSYTSDTDLLNDTILEICKSLEDKWYTGIAAEAESIHKNLKIPHKDWEGAKIEMAETFYDKYGEAITNAMYMLNHGKPSDKASKRSISKMILLEKDDQYDENGNLIREWNKIFQKYHAKLEDLIEDDADYTKAEYMTDAFKKAGTSGMAMNKAVRSCLEFTSGSSFRQWDTGKYMWEEIKEEIQAIPKDSSLSESEKRLILKDMMRWFLSGLIAKGWRESMLKDINLETSPMSILNKWWIHVYNDTSKYALNDPKIRSGTDQNAENLLERYVTQIINVETWNADYTSLVSTWDDTTWLTINNVTVDISDEVAKQMTPQKRKPQSSAQREEDDE